MWLCRGAPPWRWGPQGSAPGRPSSTKVALLAHGRHSILFCGYYESPMSKVLTINSSVGGLGSVLRLIRGWYDACFEGLEQRKFQVNVLLSWRIFIWYCVEGVESNMQLNDSWNIRRLIDFMSFDGEFIIFNWKYSEMISYCFHEFSLKIVLNFMLFSNSSFFRVMEIFLENWLVITILWFFTENSAKFQMYKKTYWKFSPNCILSFVICNM